MKKALVLDDMKVTRLTVSTYLRVYGFDVDTVEDGIEALKKLSTGNKYDLIFSDIEMPNMNGLEFLKRVKSNINYKNIPVIMLTSLNDKETVDKTKKLGAAYHMSKPYNPEKMTEALKLTGF